MSRRHAIRLAAAIAPTLLCPPARATSELAPKTASLAGHLLIATPVMGDPRFDRTVILMARHNPSGAMGITINRPVGTHKLADLMRAVGQDATGVQGDVRIFAGGPVRPEACFVLHNADYRRTGTIAIDSRVAVTSDIEVLRDISHHTGPNKSLVAFGYAGWGPGQLERELTHRAWLTVPDDPTLVFDTDRGTVWDTAFTRAERGL